MEGAAGAVAANGTPGDASMTRVAPTITSATAAEPLERNENGKRLRSESPEVSKAPGDWRSRMERTVRQQAQELAQLHRTARQLTNLLEAHAAREEVQWAGVKAWMEEREGKWEFRHEENVLWAAGISNMVAEITNEKRREVQREIQEAKGITDMDLEINPDAMEEVQILTERVMSEEMNAQRPQMEASRHAPMIPPGGKATAITPAVPIVTSTPQSDSVERSRQTDIDRPTEENGNAPSNAPKGPRAEAKAGKEPESKQPKQQQQQQQQQQQPKKPTYAEKAAMSAKGQNKTEGEFQVVERRKKNKEEEKERRRTAWNHPQ